MIVPSMRRKDLEITDINKIGKVLDNINTIHLGINNKTYPLILPISYGFEIIDDKICIYFHGGFKGIRYELLKKDNHICIEGETFSEYKKTDISATANYDSIIAFGRANELTDDSQRIHAMNLILKHCGFEDIGIDEKLFEVTAIFKVELEEVSCKSKHD